QPSQLVDYLQRLGLSPHVEGGTIVCQVPSYRGDIEREIDLIEEVARLRGVGEIDVAAKISLQGKTPQASTVATREIVRLMTAYGYNQTITFSNVKEEYAKPFAPAGVESLISLNPEQKKGEPTLRPSVLPGLLACRKFNQDLGAAEGVKLFEI